MADQLPWPGKINVPQITPSTVMKIRGFVTTPFIIWRQVFKVRFSIWNALWNVLVWVAPIFGWLDWGNLSSIVPSCSKDLSFDDFTFPTSIRIKPMGLRITKEIGASRYRYFGISGDVCNMKTLQLALGFRLSNQIRNISIRW